MLIPLISGGSPTTVPHLRRLSVPQQATLAQNSDGRKYCQYDSDIATGLGVGSFFILVASQVIIMIVTILWTEHTTLLFQPPQEQKKELLFWASEKEMEKWMFPCEAQILQKWRTSRAFLLHRLTKSIIFLFVTFALHLLLASSALSSSSCRALFHELLKQSSMFFFRISRL
ncbi:hypothetical protein RJT34_31430 [Clitoria ternatea]|uniref:Uncharacterized protein n=1 Tax=Clitoria ternatea TaxID=43366 RepID=A0AAN9EVK1_CLITE